MMSGQNFPAESFMGEPACFGSLQKRVNLNPKCQFVWGSAKAGYLYGQSLLISGETIKAKKCLEENLTLQKKIGDPGASETEKLLGTC
jgi:hypothetical protein